MQARLSPAGVPYLPDQGSGPPQSPVERRPLIVHALVFLAVCAGLQCVWGAAQGTALERLWIDTLTVKPAAALVNAITPQAGAVADGARINSAGGNLNILIGCDGTDVLFLLIAAFVACPLAWKLRWRGLAASLLLVWALNQMRLMALFYAIRADRALFDLLHTVAAPIVIVSAAMLFFYAWIHRAFGKLAAPA